MIELLGSVFTSVVGGGATGLLGVLLQRWFEHRQAQQNIEIMRLQLEAADRAQAREIEARERMADKAAAVEALQATLDAHAREVEADTAAYRASVESDRATYLAPQAQQTSRVARWLMALVDFVRGLMRPGITLYSLALLTGTAVWVQRLYERAGLAITPAQIHSLMTDVVGTVIYLSTTTVVWWFGVRPGQPPRGRT